jgi:hypothetical protein
LVAPSFPILRNGGFHISGEIRDIFIKSAPREFINSTGDAFQPAEKLTFLKFSLLGGEASASARHGLLSVRHCFKPRRETRYDATSDKIAVSRPSRNRVN